MKKLLLALMMIIMCTTAASATILPATGVDEDFKAWTGLEATPAVVLCESLSVLDARGDQGGRKVMTLNYTGKDILVIDSWDGWAQIHYSDGAELGWVRSDYLLMDPAWYLCDEDVQVYAYPDTMAPRVALLDEGTKLPIITGYDAEYESWVCVSLRGAAGWIRKTPRDTVDNTWFRPEMIQDCTFAELSFPYTTGAMIAFVDEENLAALEKLLIHANDLGGEVAGCPFGAVLTLYLADGREVQLQIATDSCCVYRVNGRDYQYARHYVTGDDSSPDNSVLFNLFDTDSLGNWVEDIPDANAYCSGQVPLYTLAGEGEAIAVLPSLTRVRWLSSTENRAFGCIEALVNGEVVQGYAPWEQLQTFEDGTEQARALDALIAHMGWSQTEAEEYRLYTPVTKQQNQFFCVTVMSQTEPQWRYHVWLDQLSGGVHSITWD